MAENEKLQPISFLVQPGTAPLGELVGLFWSIDKLYAMLGGSGIRFNWKGDMRGVEIPESEFEQHAGTLFANTRKAIKESDFNLYAPRNQAYDAIRQYGKPGDVDCVVEDFDRRFPKRAFEEEIPFSAVLCYLVNGPLKKHRREDWDEDFSE